MTKMSPEKGADIELGGLNVIRDSFVLGFHEFMLARSLLLCKPLTFFRGFV